MEYKVQREQQAAAAGTGVRRRAAAGAEPTPAHLTQASFLGTTESRVDRPVAAADVPVAAVQPETSQAVTQRNIGSLLTSATLHVPSLKAQLPRLGIPAARDQTTIPVEAHAESKQIPTLRPSSERAALPSATPPWRGGMSSEDANARDTANAWMGNTPGKNILQHQFNFEQFFTNSYVQGLHNLESELGIHVAGVIDGPGENAGLAARFGFQLGRLGAAQCAKRALIEDLVGNGGPIPDIPTCISRLHTDTFANYNIWASFVGGLPVRSFLEVTPEAIFEKLCDLCLWYLIKTEAANLRFAPELLCWIHHQMRDPKLYCRPSVAVSSQRQTLQQASEFHQHGFFFLSTIQPLYEKLKTASKMEQPTQKTWVRRFCPFTTSAGTMRMVRNASRCNYDDLNEMFWDPKCLQYAYHDQHPQAGIQNISPIKKAFREKSSYVALLLNFFPWWLFLAVLFHALLGISQTIANHGGNGFGDIGSAPFGEAIERASWCMLTLCVGKVLQVLLVCVYTFPDVRQEALMPIKLAYHLAWCIGLFVVAYVVSVGGALWWALVAVRLALVAVGNGFLHPLVAPSWIASNVEYYVSEVEKVRTAVPHGGPIAGNLLRQNFVQIIFYTAIWAVILAVKIIFDIHVITQTIVSAQNIAGLTLAYSWGFASSGSQNVWISICLWIMTGLLFAIDSYIAYSVIIPVLGVCIVRSDGIGRIRNWNDVNKTMGAWSVRGSRQRNAVTTVAAFTKKCMPVADECDAELLAAQEKLVTRTDFTEAVSWMHQVHNLTASWFIFGRVWNLMIHSLREEDLISDNELCLMNFGSDSNCRAPQWPLWLAQGKLQLVLMTQWEHCQAMSSQSRSVSLDALHRALYNIDSHAADAFVEICCALPRILALACSVHPACAGQVGRLDAVLNSDWEAQVRSAQALVDAWSVVLHACPVQDIHLELITQSVAQQFLEQVNGVCYELLDCNTVIRDVGSSKLLQCTASILDIIAGAASGTKQSELQHFLGLLRSEQTICRSALQRLEEAQMKQMYMSSLETIFRCSTLTQAGYRDFRPEVPETQRRIAFWLNSLYMKQLKKVSSPIEMPSFTALTPQYAEAVIYDKDAFLVKVNEHGVTPLIYLQSLHPIEWRNFKERIGTEDDAGVWLQTSDAVGNTIDGTVETRLWASYRGQTLSRTVRGVMEYARAFRLLSFFDILVRDTLQHVRSIMSRDLAQVGHQQSQVIGHSMLAAAIQAEWLTAKKVAYVCCCQKYGDSAPDDIIRRTDIDLLMGMHPLLRVAFFKEHTFRDQTTLYSVCAQNGQVQHCIAIPGNPIRDQIGEGKPENQNNGQNFLTGRIIQVLDMNQSGYAEEAIKLPNVLEEFATVSSMQRPIAMVGTREHIFTQGLATPALFMSYQELQFGVVWQRIMYDPLRVRLHYGHPDWMDKVFMMTRGGFAKSSKIVNVSEDIFAGITAALRGGESKQIQYVQLGKGRDIGMLQIAQFEAKVSGGSAVSMTTRDAVRITNNMEFFRMLSLWHTWAGYYVSNVIVVVATTFFLYFYLALAISSIDGIIFASESSVSIVGNVLIINWIAQLGGIYIIPLVSLLALEHGILAGIWRILHMIFTLGPLFYVAEMQTKAYYFDQALAFGKQVYLATGRDFVIRHVPFAEIYRAVSFSHLYLGIELLFLMILILAYGSFSGVITFVFFFAASWVFILAQLFSFLWFNPFALESRYVGADFTSWFRWIRGSEGPTPDQSYDAWMNNMVAPYLSAPSWVRWYHMLRLLRFPALAAAMLYRTSISHASAAAGLSEGIFLAGMFVLPLLIVASFECTHLLAAKCAKAPRTGEQPRPRASLSLLGILQVAFGIVWVAGITLLIIFGASSSQLDGGDAILLLMSLFVMMWFTSKLAFVANVLCLRRGALTIHKGFDLFIGFVLLSVQMLFAVIPYGAMSHNSLLFAPRYARTLEVVLGARAKNTPPSGDNRENN